MKDMEQTLVQTADPRTVLLKEVLLRDLKQLARHIETYGLDYDFSDPKTWVNDPYEQERLEEILQNYIDFVADVERSAYRIELDQSSQAEVIATRVRAQGKRAAWKSILKQAIKVGLAELLKRGEQWRLTIMYYQSCGVSMTVQSYNDTAPSIPLGELGDCSSSNRYGEHLGLPELRTLHLERWLDKVNRSLTIGNTQCF